jgi:hypothetical protein
MAATNIYQAKVNLKAMLEAHSWTGADPVIRWGQPVEAEKGAFDLVYLGLGEITDEHRTLGDYHATELFRLLVVADVQRAGDNEQDVERRLWELHDDVITVLRSDTTLDGAVSHLTDYVVRQSNVPAPNAWRSQVVIDVGVQGQISYL